jgi:hypothetical protein
MNAILLPSLLLVCAADETPPAPKLPLGRDTSFVTGPLDKDGYIDYEAALNAELGRGVTPDTNANALLVLALGPTPDGVEFPPAYYKWLDVAAPPRDGDYFVGILDFSRDRLRLGGAEADGLLEFLDRAAVRPWVATDCPPLAQWLTANEKPLALARAAAERPAYFHPLVSRRKADAPSNLLATLGGPAGAYQQLGSALAARATLRLGEKKYAEAWHDTLAAYRLGHLITRGGLLIDAMIGRHIAEGASRAALAYLDRAELTAEQTLERLKDLRAIPPATPSARSVDLMERMAHLDMIQSIRRGGGGKPLAGLLVPGYQPTDDESRALGAADWAVMMRTLNAWLDRQTAAMRRTDRAAREKAFDGIKRDIGAAGDEIHKPGAFVKLLAEKDAGKRLGKAGADALVGFALPGLRGAQRGDDRAAQAERNLHVAFALAAYRKDNDRYPEALADLAPQYLATVPDDLFSGKPLIYKPTARGYRLYSVGPDGTDDGGRGEKDAPPGDDIGVRMPLPAPDKK